MSSLKPIIIKRDITLLLSKNSDKPYSLADISQGTGYSVWIIEQVLEDIMHSNFCIEKKQGQFIYKEHNYVV